MMIAVLIPLLGYIYVKKSSDNAVVMPRHYIYDSVDVKTKNGKEFIDTVWHKVGDFSFTNQVGQQVGWADMMESFSGRQNRFPLLFHQLIG